MCMREPATGRQAGRVRFVYHVLRYLLPLKYPWTLGRDLRYLWLMNEGCIVELWEV